MHKVHLSPDQEAVSTKLVKLRKATVAVGKLLFGPIANFACRLAIEPDWGKVDSKLGRLTEVHGIDCKELARILTCKSKIMPDSSPQEAAVQWLKGNDSSGVILSCWGQEVIRRANESKDVAFFKKLGECIKGWHKRKKRSLAEDLNEVRFALLMWWRPEGDWPGLAYCTLAARCEFLGQLELRGGLRFPFIKNISPKNLDMIRRRLRLIPARSPFVCSIKYIDFSYVFF